MLFTYVINLKMADKTDSDSFVMPFSKLNSFQGDKNKYIFIALR